MDIPNRESSTVIALDIGGTAIKAAVIKGGVLTAQKQIPTQAHKGGAHVLSLAEDLIRSFFPEHRADAIGISTAGQVDPVEGKIIYANQNIPAYTGARVKALFEDIFGLPVAVENDVNAAALGEYLYGAGRGHKDFVCLTYGTGIGGAIILNGELYRGSSFSAGEFGAILTHPENRRPEIDMYSGGYEKYASVSALVQRAKRLDSSLSDGRTIFARREEPKVASLIADWVREITYGLITVVHMLNPSCLVLGGGVMEQECLIPLIRESLEESLIPSFRKVDILGASLGNRAGVLGVSHLALLELERSSRGRDR